MPVLFRFWIDPQTGTHNPGYLQPHGPGLAVEVGVPSAHAAALTAGSHPLPPSAPGSALIDTGASVSAVDLTILQGLGIRAVNSIPLVTPSGTTTQGVYVVRLTFPGSPIPTLDPVPVMGSSLQGFGHIALLGRDFLAGALMNYDGVHGYWTIAF